MAAAQERQKVHYDSRHQQGSYEAGDLVLVKNVRKLSKKGDKMKPNWTGPYEVVEQLSWKNKLPTEKQGNQSKLEDSLQ